MRRILSVIGSGAPSPALEAAALALGRSAVEGGWRIACGGLGGVMAAACRGARAAAGYREGDTIGLLPGTDRAAANPWVDVAIPTGLGLARNLLVVSAGDAVVAVGGGSGTLSEIALAWQIGRPVIALETGEGWADRLAGVRLDARRTGSVLRARSAEEAVALAAAAVGL